MAVESEDCAPESGLGGIESSAISIGLPLIDEQEELILLVFCSIKSKLEAVVSSRPANGVLNLEVLRDAGLRTLNRVSKNQIAIKKSDVRWSGE